jgi:[ribosomal protein S18]-alanine N-acetyltransferase
LIGRFGFLIEHDLFGRPVSTVADRALMNFFHRLFSRRKPGFSEATARDASAVAAVHGASFQRGWEEDEVYRLLIDPGAVAHRVTLGQALIGFVLSRLAAGEAEILSLAVAPAWRGRKLARTLLDLHLRRLAGLGARAVFLEVDQANAPACRLYRQAGFQEVGKRPGYYQGGGNALVLRRDLG